ncbi:MAG: oxidoreductase [Acidimicrobiia bacterium]|nr:oxidoreductase [Acidimicrobiia bacterium]MDH5236317.1 oxidoreductase [Acidimicrobiia bacterium]
MFRALLLEQDDEGVVTNRIATLDEADLPAGDVLVDVEYSTVNYKDGLAIKNRNRVVRSFPMVPGIDFAGVVAQSSHGDFVAGDRVVLNGWGVGESHWGGFAQKARVSGDWLVALPDTFSTQQAMAVGTAGYTSMLAVLALEEHDITPDRGPIVVTGSSGGVGSTAIAILGQLGYEVVASTGRPAEADYLRSLGAADVIDRAELSGESPPLAKARWAGAVDAVGSTTLANILAATRDNGCVAACGLAQGVDLPTTVMPFILRGVTLAGINSVTVPRIRRQLCWERLGTDLDPDKLAGMTTVEPLDALPRLADEILAGRIRGRVVIDVNA